MIKSISTSKGTIVIREGNRGDVIQYRELRLFALQESPTSFSADYQTNQDHPMSFWEGRLNINEHGIILFVEHDSKLIGMTGIYKGETPKTKHSAYIWGVYIRPEWRGMHIAEELISACMDWAGERKVEIVKLGVVTTNASAIRCYERCGFTVYGTEPRGIFYEEKYYDENLMFKTLNPS